MKKLTAFLILSYLLFTINNFSKSHAANNNNLTNDDVLRIGVLLPLTGEFKDLGESFLSSIRLALSDIGNTNIKIYPKDSRANAFDTYEAAKKFEELEIKIVIGPIFHESLERLDEISNITFISFTNEIDRIPKNTIAFGININSQIEILDKYFDKINVSKTLFLSPKNKFINQTNIINDSKLKFYKTFPYDISPKKITSEIEKLTKYNERKKDLERRILILEKSDLFKDKQELKKLEQKHTLGRVNFDSVFVIDFGERLKSVLTSFMFSDISNEEVNFFTVNQWFDETFFNENALENLHFPSIDLDNFNKFNNKFTKTFNKKANKVSILAYDMVGLIYYCWSNNNYRFKAEQLYNKKGFKGLHGNFVIENNQSKQKLKIYKVSGKKFIKVF